MKRDIRDSALYGEAAMLYQTLRQPGTGRITDVVDAHVSPDGRHATFAGALMDKLEGLAPTRICEIDLVSGNTRVLTFGPNTDRLPKYSPDNRHIAFLSDRRRRGDFQLYLLDPLSGVAQTTAQIPGWIEYLHWSPDGTRILLGVAGHGADVAGNQGAIASIALTSDMPSWAPMLETGDENYRWRSAWVYDLRSGSVRQINQSTINIWEAAWCGNDSILAVASSGPAEGEWYAAQLQMLNVTTGKSRVVYHPRDQLGWPCASPSGKGLAVVEAICSDRWIVAGQLLLIHSESATAHRVDTNGVDVSCVEWLSEERVLFAGHRGLECVVGVLEVQSRTITEKWASREITTGGFLAKVAACKTTGDCVLLGEGFLRAPEIAMIRDGQYEIVKSFDAGYGREAQVVDRVEYVSWNAPDGLEIQGFLLLPKGKPPHPLVMHVHGGPVALWRPLWLGRRAASILMLLKRGYAIFLPNPRGSSGRGRDYARHVLGEMGGTDTHDYLSGLDYLVRRGIADPKRLGVTGTSYGGYMTSWLITQDTRFGAAVSVAPITNFVTGHLLSNIPQFVASFLADDYTNPGGKYFQRSPIMHARKVKTPTLSICGALDTCTPPEEAMQFHRALKENGVNSALLTYPEEGHGIRRLPAAIDYAARVVGWFEEHIGASSSES